MSALTGSIAHELGQPLNSILHNAQAARCWSPPTAPHPRRCARSCPTSVRQIFRATQIIERHLAMLRNRQFEKRPLDIHAVVRESLALVAHDAKSDRSRSTSELPSDPCVVVGDQVLLSRFSSIS